MIEIFTYLLFMFLLKLAEAVKWIIAGLFFPIAYFFNYLDEQTPRGMSKKIEGLEDDDFAALICEILSMKKFYNVRRDEYDMNIVTGERNNKKIMCLCVAGKNKEIKSYIINYAIKSAKARNVSKFVICYNCEITDAALAYARVSGVYLAAPDIIAKDWCIAKKNKRKSNHSAQRKDTKLQ